MIINDKEYKMKYTGYTLYLYKKEFQADMLTDCKNIKENFDVVIVMQICWAMLKTGDDNAPSFREFMDNVNINSPDLFNEMNECLSRDGNATKELKKKTLMEKITNH